MKRLAMTATWSVLAFAITTLIAYLMTGDIIKGGTIGLLCRGFKIPAYWFHDSLYAKHWRDKPLALEPVPDYEPHAILSAEARDYCGAG